MSERFLVSVDIDDVLFPTAGMILEHYKENYGVEIAQDQFYSNDPAVWGVEEYSEAIRRVSAFLHSDAFLHHAPIEGAFEGTYALRESGAELVPLTGRDDTQRAATKEAIDTYFPDIFSNETLFSNHFNAELRRSKGEMCNELGADYHIDDHIVHINSLARYVTKGVVFGGYPWADAPAEGDVLYAPNWAVLPGVVAQDRLSREA